MDKDLNKTNVDTNVIDNSNLTSTTSNSKIKISKQTKKKLKVKKEKEPKDFKLMFKEFPIKMVKEISKIKWSGTDSLSKKFIIVILFMLIFAVIFYSLDLGIQQLFQLIKVF
ncbi:Preprotein translocase subunit SecE [Mycoplasma yeatsii 13926]|uniref:Preprotein translocase subunit SecE n=1 Tax=Mycoplasma yeatsii 13926 TaxID=1188240 RepID=S6G870_9MOLU|nr:preprotein translocase subunit SecE [Mycoplasma yeatsii]EOA07244.1 Preprotein translocase subunit SecE [Mycoplasma yeatsii 13926]